MAGAPPVSIAPVLVWMDLEMTGLDPARHTIVEIATLITDDNLSVVAEGLTWSFTAMPPHWQPWTTS